MPELTPSQTIGPFFHPGLLREPWNEVAGPSVAGSRIRLEGRVLDGEGRPVDDAMVEVWQADGDGRYGHADPAGGSFVGFGRSRTDGQGRYWFETILPGPVESPGGVQAPYLNVHVFARGLLDRLATRIYFEGHPANPNDPVLRSVPAHRRPTLVARRAERDGVAVYDLDIVLQGPGETVFFDT